uniref:EGF-like calcium-binding domain-containing protein n=1 Tax=Oryza glumipatula TaxID=40148 RepID=A0A0D9ZIF8_9ORYZ
MLHNSCWIGVANLQLRFVRSNSKGFLSSRSSLWNRINIVSSSANVLWGINNRPTCASAKDNQTDYACVSINSECMDMSIDLGYLCECNSGYVGNPYVLDGCTRDEVYHPVQQKANCSRRCGNISVPFPFGLEEGGAARKLFQLNCTNVTSSTLQFDRGHVVTDIDFTEGVVDIKLTSGLEEGAFRMYRSGEPYLYASFGEAVISLHWAAANLTCQEAQKNHSRYACVSANSTCLGVDSTDCYVGYRCKCMDGFHGNPYVVNGCEDIDECTKTPGICKGICHNDIGSYQCMECPHKTEYDVTAMQCVSRKKQNLLIEYYHTGQLNEKSDVYSFGVVLVELLLRKEPILTSEIGLKENLSNYFLWERKVRPIRDIVAGQILEETTEEEINNVASLAEDCLSLRQDERPTMKQVELALQFLLNKRLNSCRTVQANKEEMEPFIMTKVQHSTENSNVEFLSNKATVSSYQPGLEHEFMSSATIPC